MTSTYKTLTVVLALLAPLGLRAAATNPNLKVGDPAPALLAASAATSESTPNQPRKYDIAAYYWPAYQFGDERWNRFFKDRIGEWEIIRDCKPGAPGHLQPNVPLWGYEDESNPKVMEKKIDAAVSHGVNVFIFDWYWYENQPFLENALNNGFLGAKNNRQIQFYLMWANHDATTLWDKEKSNQGARIIWPGAVDRPTFDTVVDRVIERYFKQPNYYKIDGKPVFSVYELSTLINGLGGIGKTAEALDSFRAKVKAAGFPGLHLQAVLWGRIPKELSNVPGDTQPTQDNTIKKLGIDSLTNYQWCHFTNPSGQYNAWGANATRRWENWAKEFSVPYYPHVAVGWDTNPRFKNYRQTTIYNRSPEAFANFLKNARAHVDKHNLHPGLITINSWNEWSEGSYLEPDERFGMKYLEAVRDVFGADGSGSFDPGRADASRSHPRE